VSVCALYLGISAALVLWAAVLVVERRLEGGVCPAVVCLAGVVAIGAFQVVPLPPSVLTVISPARAQLRAELLPAEHETVRGEPVDPPPEPVLSFDPGATRAQVVKLLAVLGLFAVVRYCVASPASFRRLAVVCAVNGTALSVFALAQKFSSPPTVIYWSFEAQGTAFGPFVCKNHFPYYANVCFGLTLGLLAGLAAPRTRSGEPGGGAGELFRHPAAPWLAAALAFMFVADLYSLSRGGVIALAAAGLAAGLIAIVGRPKGGAGDETGRSVGVAAVVVLVGVLGVGLVGWFGADAVTKRFGTLESTDALDRGRRDAWERTAPLALRFPAWGTGDGTFATAEPQQRKPGDDQLILWEHAHNDYLEASVEGGFPQLVLLLVAAAIVFRAGLRAYRRSGEPRPGAAAEGALVLGGLFGFTAVLVHSLGDFGLHMPAIVVLVTVLAAQLVAAGDRARTESAPAAGTDQPTGGITWVLVAAACLLVAAVLPADGWRRERADHFRRAAIRAEKRLPAGDRDLVVEYLKAAVALVPDDTALRLRLADVRYEEYLAHRSATVPPGRDPVTTDLRPAIREYLRVRDANPLLDRPHARLAGGRSQLDHADSVINYLTRATRLRPTDGGLWYLLGLARLDGGDPDGAWECWRRALVCSPVHLETVVPAALDRLGPAGLVERVLPPRAEVVVAAARHPALADRPADRRVVLTGALALFESAASERADDLYLRAALLRETGNAKAAISVYERAVAKAPDRLEWQLELAELCFTTGDIPKAKEHLRGVLRDRPDLAGARELNAALVRAETGQR
jgi:O-antigen ligase/tetratricopeptide (TPR) repeat protein